MTTKRQVKGSAYRVIKEVEAYLARVLATVEGEALARAERAIGGYDLVHEEFTEGLESDESNPFEEVGMPSLEDLTEGVKMLVADVLSNLKDVREEIDKI